MILETKLARLKLEKRTKKKTSQPACPSQLIYTFYSNDDLQKLPHLLHNRSPQQQLPLPAPAFLSMRYFYTFDGIVDLLNLESAHALGTSSLERATQQQQRAARRTAAATNANPFSNIDRQNYMTAQLQPVPSPSSTPPPPPPSLNMPPLAAGVSAPPPLSPPLFSFTTFPPPLPPRGRGDGRGFLAAEPAERRRVVIMGSGDAGAEGAERLRDAAGAAAGGVVLVGALARGRKGTLRFGVDLGLGLGLGFALEAEEGAGRLVAGDAGGILEALAEPPGGMNLRGKSSYKGLVSVFLPRKGVDIRTEAGRVKKKDKAAVNAARNRFCGLFYGTLDTDNDGYILRQANVRGSW